MFYFVANLKRYSVLETDEDDRFDAYLLSADYASRLSELASLVNIEGRILVADNGNMDTFRSLGKAFAAEAKELDVVRQAWEKARGHYARPGQLPEDLRDRFRVLAQKIAARSEAITTDTFARDAVRRQLSVHPTMIVGMEDLTLATMGALNLEPEYADLPSSFFEERVRRALTFAQRTTKGEFGELHGKVLAGLHALDYDSGVLAGQLAAEAGIDGVAVGMFGALTDRNYVDFRVEDGKVYELERAVPRPYLRVIEIAAGVLEGFRRAGRVRPVFHVLGVGTPILLPLLCLLAHGDHYFATDSTAPIVDGWSSPTISLYVTDPAPLKYKAYRVADVWIRGGRGWDCACPYCSGFREAHPPAIDQAQNWWREQGQPDITKQMLERDGPLSAWLPFLGYPADDKLRGEAGRARVGHNHWILRQLELEIRSKSHNWSELLAWVEGIVDAYRQSTGSPAWKAAVTEAYTLSLAVGQRLRQFQILAPGAASTRLIGDDVEIDKDEHQRDNNEDQPDRDGSPHHAERGLAGESPTRIIGHDHTVANPNAVGKALGMSPDFLVGCGEPLTSHESSCVLLRATLEQIRKAEKVARAWDQLQPLATGLAGQAAGLLDVVRANTQAVRGRVEQQTAYIAALHTFLAEMDNAELNARVDALRGGHTPMTRLAELTTRAAESAQVPFVATCVAAKAISFRLAYMAAHVAAASKDERTQELSLHDDVISKWVSSFAQASASFANDGLSQFHDLFADDNASLASARALARTVLDEAGPRGLLAAQVLGSVSRHGISPELLGELGPVVLDLAEAGDRLGLLVAYAAHGLAHAHSLAGESWLSGERDAAHLEFASNVPTGVRIRIDELGDVGANVLVEIEGRVESLTIEHDPSPPKFSSFVVLRAFGAGASVRLRAHMFSLEKNGLAVGACCKVRGFVRRQQAWQRENETGLDIDRVSLSKLRKASWLDDVTYRMRPYFRLYQDELNLFNTPGGV